MKSYHVVVGPARPAGHPHRTGSPDGLLKQLRYPAFVWCVSQAIVYSTLTVVASVMRPDRTPRSAGPLFLSRVAQWDASWYHWIAVHGYDRYGAHGHHLNVGAFYPLYPLLYRIVGLLPGPMVLWGCVLSSGMFLAALCLVFRTTAAVAGNTVAQRAVLYLAMFPTAAVFFVPYSESVFLALAAGSLYLLAKGRVTGAAVVASFAVLTRPLGVALIPAIGWVIYRRPGVRVADYGTLLFPVMAEAVFGGYLWAVTGDPLASGHAEARGWGRGLSFLPGQMFHAVRAGAFGAGGWQAIVEVAFVVLWYYLLYRIVKMRVPGEYIIFAAAVVGISTWAGPLLSIGRLGMVGFPLFWGLADATESRLGVSAVTAVFVASLIGLTAAMYGSGAITP